MLDNTLAKIRKFIPSRVFSFFQPAYHYFLALTANIIYGFPSKKIKVIGVTGTKGKSTTTEIISAILEEAGYKTALSNTIRYKIGDKSVDNMFKMSMPGRFFVQWLIRQAVDQKCDYIILEMTSQGTIQYRHKFIDLDAFVFTNLSPEHIESHGSYEKYLKAKLEIGKEFSHSQKRPRILIVNGDDKESDKFFCFEAEIKRNFNLKDQNIESLLQGEFNKYNVLAATTLCTVLGIKEEMIKSAVSKFKGVKGRMEKVDLGQNFTVIVDYAHTVDSLEKVYKIFENSKKICVLGGTGGGRDRWKRQEMGRVADKYCEEIILTNEDPYDEDPEQIIEDVSKGVTEKTPKIIMDRRLAIAHALQRGKPGYIVLITGKGTDPYIMGPNNSKIPWSDAQVAKDELEKLLYFN